MPRLPTELLEEVIQWMAADRNASLSNVARANSTCGDLVRAARFRNVGLDGCTRSLQFVAMLALGCIRRQNGSTEPTVGDYVRGLGYTAFYARPYSEDPEIYGVPSPEMRYENSETEEKVQALQKDLQKSLQKKLENLDWWLRRIREALILQPTEVYRAQCDKEAREACNALVSVKLPTDDLPDEDTLRVYHTTMLAMIRFAIPQLKGLSLTEPQARINSGPAPPLWPDLTACLSQVQELWISMSLDQWANVKIVPARLAVRSLSLETERNSYYTESGAVWSELDPRLHMADKSVAGILTACASTLEKLTLELEVPSRAVTLLASGVGVNVNFPALTTLQLRRMDLGRDLFKSLMRSPMCRLEVGCGPFEREDTFPLLADMLPKLRYLRLDLRTFGIPLTPMWVNGLALFLSAHKDIKHIKIIPPYPTDGLDRCIIPTLAGGQFTSLTTLALTFLPAPPHPAHVQPATPLTMASASLAAIGLIDSLEQLGLAFKSECACRWEINHDLLRGWLGGLQKLKLLFLEGDTWAGRFTPRAHDNTEEPKHLSIEYGTLGASMFGSLRDMMDLRARPELDGWDLESFEGLIWKPGPNIDLGDPLQQIGPIRDLYCFMFTRDYMDRHHRPCEDVDFYMIVQRNCALDEAERYAAAFPKLRMVYLGENLMRIGVLGSGHHGNATPCLIRKRYMTNFHPWAEFDMERGWPDDWTWRWAEE